MFWIDGRLREVVAHGGSTVFRESAQSQKALCMVLSSLFYK